MRQGQKSTGDSEHTQKEQLYTERSTVQATGDGVMFLFFIAKH